MEELGPRLVHQRADMHAHNLEQNTAYNIYKHLQAALVAPSHSDVAARGCR